MTTQRRRGNKQTASYYGIIKLYEDNQWKGQARLIFSDNADNTNDNFVFVRKLNNFVNTAMEGPILGDFEQADVDVEMQQAYELNDLFTGLNQQIGILCACIYPIKRHTNIQ